MHVRHQDTWVMLDEKLDKMLQTTTTLLLIAIARVVNPSVDREFWVIPRPGVG
jgi:hypothetical protein